MTTLKPIVFVFPRSFVLLFTIVFRQLCLLHEVRAFLGYKILFPFLQAEVLQAIYKEYTFDEFLDFSNSTFEMNWNVNNLLTEIQNVSGKLKVSSHF